MTSTPPKHKPTLVHRPDLVDVVIATGGSLAFLEQWREQLAPYHLIIVQTVAGPSLNVPAGFDYELHTPADAKARLGDKAWCLCTGDQLSRSYGYLVSKKRYIYTLTDCCGVATDPSGKPVLALEQHLTNLTSPATPMFFNTLYDPYRPGTDFVRGYPFSLREGHPTSVSHGLWLNKPDYDTATAMVKPLERNKRYVDAALTVPRGTLYPMSNINLAFDAELVGPAMYTGLSSDDQSVDDMWAGLCAKAISDHLGHGHKTGIPYIHHDDGAKDPSKGVNMIQKDSKALAWQESLVPFFSTVKLSPESTTAEMAYLDLATKVLQEFGNKDEYFVRLADAMVAWVACWKLVKGA